MALIHTDLRETHSIPVGTREWIVSARTCPALQEHGMRALGRSAATGGFAFVRTRPDLGQVLACTGGTGRVLVDGAWVTCGAGTAYVTPPGVHHAYRAERKWAVCWVIFKDAPGSPLDEVRAPTLVRVDAQPLSAAINELYRESVGPGDLTVMRQWTGLIHSHAERMCRRGDGDTRLLALWEVVDADLARPWTLTELARLVSMSGEHLRRLCVRQHGCTPMRRVAQMRVRRAATLLIATPWSVESIASAVGFGNAFAFSTAFKRQTGQTPTGYRRADMSDKP